MTPLQKVAQWFLDHLNFLESLLDLAIHTQRTLNHFEFTDKVISGLSGSHLEVNFICPVCPETTNADSCYCIIDFDLARHNPVTLMHQYNFNAADPRTEKLDLLTFNDGLHLEGRGYEDFQPIWLLIQQRLLDCTAGKQDGHVCS